MLYAFKRFQKTNPGRWIRIVLISLLFIFAFPQPASADTLIVDRFDDDPGAVFCDDLAPMDCSLRGAIIRANALLPGSDTIYLSEGIYQLSVPGPGEDLAGSGDLDITDTLTISGAGRTQTIINGGGLDRVFEVMPGVSLSLNSLTVQGGLGPPAEAGGIFNWGLLALDDVSVSNNIGEGIVAFHNGVDPWPYPEVDLYNSMISENSLTGIHATNTTLILDQSTVGGNQDGGIRTMGGEVTVVDSHVTYNASSDVGGGLSLVMSSSDRIVRSTISGNSAVGHGGGIYFWGWSMGENHLVLENVTLSGNQAGEHGGGLIADSGAGSEVALYNVTITDNTADHNHNNDGDGGGIYNNNGARVTMQNSILAANIDGTTSGSKVLDCAGVLDSGGYNLIGAVDGCSGATGTDLTGTFSSPLDPQIGVLDDNGGPTETHALLPGSPAVDAANPAGCTGLGGTPLLEDQRGWSRPIDGDLDGTATCDIGAYESLPPAPTNLQASDGTYTDKIQVTWDAVPGASSYELYRYTSASGTPGLVEPPPTGTTYDDTGTPAGQENWYWVKACDESNCSDFSSSDSGWRSVIPPGNVQASDGTYTDKVVISWDSAPGADTYRVYRAASELGTKVQIGSPPTCSYDDTTALPGKTYYYWVTSCAWGNCGGYSAYDTGWRFGYLIYLPLIMR